MGAPSARVFELSRRWVEKGQEVTVLTGFPHHPTGVIPSQYRQHFFKREKIDGIKVIRTYVYPTANKGFIKRIANYLSFMFSSLLLGATNIHEIDVIIATSPQFFVAIAGFIISKMKNRPLVLEIRDLWPESIVQLGQLKNRTIITILEFIEIYLYRKAHSIVVVAESSVPILKNKGIDPSKIRVVKNGVDLELFDPARTNSSLKKSLSLDQKFVVSYIGTLGLSHALDKVLQSASILQNNSDIHFLLIGEGAEKDHLKKLTKSLNLTNVTFLDQINKQLLPDYYGISDIVLVTLRKLPLFQCVIPSKIFEIMAMGKPVLLTVDGEAREMVINQAGAGIFVEPENFQEMALTITDLCKNRSSLTDYGSNGLNFVRTNYDRLTIADNYLAYLRQIIE